MTEMQRRSLLERLIGKPLPWLAWAWGALAVVWVVFAVVEPSGFHTFMAVTWTILAAVQISSVSFARRRASNRVRIMDEHSEADTATLRSRSADESNR